MPNEAPKSTTWPVAHVRFAVSVPSPHNSSSLTDVKSDGKTMRIEFDPGLRMVLLTALKPGKPAKEGDPPFYVEHAERPMVRVPVENVVFMR